MESLPRMRLQMEIASSPVKSENWLMNSTILSSASHTYGPRLYIIDVVGTIADKERLIPQLEGNFDKAAVEYYTANGVSQKKAEAKLALGKKLRAKNRRDPSYEKMQDEVAAYSYEKGKIKLEIYDDAHTALKEMRESGAEIAIFSSGMDKSLQPAFKSVRLDGGKSLDDYVSKYFSSNQVGPKSRRETFERIPKDMGVEISDCVYIDDEAKVTDIASKANFRQVYQIQREETATHAGTNGEKHGAESHGTGHEEAHQHMHAGKGSHHSGYKTIKSLKEAVSKGHDNSDKSPHNGPNQESHGQSDHGEGGHDGATESTEAAHSDGGHH